MEARQAPQHILNACQTTIEKNKRTTQYPRVSSTAGISCLARSNKQPSEVSFRLYVHEIIAWQAATEEQRDSSLHTLAHDSKYRVLAGIIRYVNRTIYNAHHSIDGNTPRDKIMIKKEVLPSPRSKTQDMTPMNAIIYLERYMISTFEFFKRNSIDGRGLKVDGFVHYGDRYLNAFWDGKEIVFGDRDGIIFNSFTDELDVIGHELTHGVVPYTSPLAYSFQSGALNESLADVFRIMIKQWEAIQAIHRLRINLIGSSERESGAKASTVEVYLI